MKIKYYIVLFLLLSLGSCKKYLETEPADFIDPKDYYETEEHLRFARAGVYHILGTSGLWGSNANYLFAWQGDEGYYNRPTPPTGPMFYNYSTGDAYNNNLWSTLYNGINRANVVLANLDKNPGISQAVRDVIRGEMYFLRGYFYSVLATNYGGVPLKLTATSSIVEVDIARSTLKETYDQVVKDMEAAEPLVPGITSLGYGGAISKSAVRGMLARVNLYMAGEPLKDKTRYTEVIKWSKKVIDDAEAAHALNPSYSQIFINLVADKYDIKESIWEAEFWGNGTDASLNETTNMGYINGPSSVASSANGTAVAYFNITSKFYNAFEPGDNRKWWSTVHFGYPAVATSPKTMSALPANEGVKAQMKPGKWRREFEVVAPKTTVTPTNVPLLRFADILLMYAEADNEVNGTPSATAIEYVNRVRKRSWSTGVKSVTVTNGGAGYTTAPTVTFSAGVGGATATGTAVISGGRVTAINLSRDLTAVLFNVEGKYTSVPTVTITGGGGTGATATAAINLLTDAELTPAQTASKAAFLEVIQNERFRELNYEGLRKADLLRWGIFFPVMQDIADRLAIEVPTTPFFSQIFRNVERKHQFMPIPSSETSTNQLMVQNPFW
ncbi:hypothetical protein ABIE26_002671 [Pedobacter africanus]|uniref:Uncharacterized protein n=1 Tax=Pedobacter africanus TaxID=151894 RepID=A0ACC6KX45_9SPHI|nr:RagB/SusD family nutrient uptake outer membrane protein [Pedobacter africanus]MDR6783940.1 hypothetical protein [Pedobacter africanus]